MCLLYSLIILFLYPHWSNAGIFDEEEEDEASPDEKEVVEVAEDSGDEDIEDALNC